MKPEVNEVLAQLKQSMEEMDNPTQETPATEKRINYPAHVKPLETRVLAALDSGCRTAKTINTYVGRDVPERVVNMKLGQLVARGKIGRKVSDSTGYLKYYPYKIAKEKGILEIPKKRKSKVNPFEFKPAERATEFVAPRSLEIADQLHIDQDRENYILFLEKRVTEWQTEARRLQREVDAKSSVVAYDQALEQIESLRKEIQRLTIIVEYYEGKASK